MTYLYVHIHATYWSHLDYLAVTILAIRGELCKFRSFFAMYFSQRWNLFPVASMLI